MTIVLLTEQILGQIQVTYSDRNVSYIKKVKRMSIIGIDDAEIVDKIICESMCNTISRSK